MEDDEIETHSEEIFHIVPKIDAKFLLDMLEEAGYNFEEEKKMNYYNLVCVYTDGCNSIKENITVEATEENLAKLRKIAKNFVGYEAYHLLGEKKRHEEICTEEFYDDGEFRFAGIREVVIGIPEGVEEKYSQEKDEEF